MDIAIFSVLAFAPTEDGKFKVLSHYVAGTSSADAERRILEGEPEHLPGRRFITTDQANERHHTPACRLYTTGMRESIVDAYELERWVTANTMPDPDEAQGFVGFREF